MGTAHPSCDLSLCYCSVPQAARDLGYSSVLKMSLPVFSDVLKPTSLFTVPLKQFSVVFLLLSSLGMFHYTESYLRGSGPRIWALLSYGITGSEYDNESRACEAGKNGAGCLNAASARSSGNDLG